MNKQNPFCNKSLVLTLTFSFLFLFFISTVSSISWTDQSVVIQSFQGNMTNLSELQDVNVPAPNDNDILNYDTSTFSWIASPSSSLNTIWQRIGNIISPINTGDNLNMGGNNITDIIRTVYNVTGCEEDAIAGTVCWNADDMTLNIVTGLDSTVLQVNQETVGIGINKEGRTLPDGTIVSQFGSQGDRMTFVAADSTNISRSSMIGVLTQSCEDNAECFVNIFGLVRNIDTSMWSTGNKLYIDSTQPGNFTNVIPTLPNNPIWVATAIVIHEQTGSIFVFPTIDPSDGFLIQNIWATGNITVTDSIKQDNYRITSRENNSYVVDKSFAIMMTGPTGVELPHFLLQPGGPDQASIFVRSLIIANENETVLSGENATSCSEWAIAFNETRKIDCNTTTTGADLWVGDDLQVNGDAWLKNSLGEWRFTTHTLTNIDEITNNLLLSRSNVSLFGTTFTITDDVGEDINVVISRSETIKDISTENVTVTLGTNSSPIQNFITYINPANPTLTASLSLPSEDSANVARMMLGAEGNIYASLGGRSSIDEFIRGSYLRWFNTGVLYVSGFEPFIDDTNISIESGAMTVLLDTHSAVAGVDLINDWSFLVLSNGSYLQFNSLESITEYADGGTISNNKYYNLVCGIVHNDVNGHRMMCIVQNEPSSEYINIVGAETDVYDALNIFPSDAFLKNLFMPVARMVVQKSAGADEFKMLSNGGMYFDIRGTTSSAGAPASSGIINHNELNNLAWSVAGHIFDTLLDLNSNDIIGVSNLNMSGDLRVDTIFAKNYSSQSPINFINTSGSSLVTFLETGNVGIGTLLPTQKLEINGAINITGVTDGDFTCYSYNPNGGCMLGGNSTCNILFSPDGLSSQEACN